MSTASISKPDYLFDRDREWRSLLEFIAHDDPAVSFGVVSGRRRQGKTYLLRALTEVTGGFFFEAVEATEAESLRMFGAAMARHAGSPAEFSFSNWGDALTYFFSLAGERPTPLIIDEFPYLLDASPGLASLLKRELDERMMSAAGRNRSRVLVCGSALTVMGSLLSGSAPLRGRAQLEMVVHPFDYREAALYWEITDPKLAFLVHAVVGGTPAYRRFARGERPANLSDFDDWVTRVVLDQDSPLLREARYLLAGETEIREPGLYQSVLAAISAGKRTSGGIANYVGRRANTLAHPLTVLEDCGLVLKEPDPFRNSRFTYRVTEPLVTFYETVIRPRWTDLSVGLAGEVWHESRPTFLANVAGPHFEAVCRDFVRLHARSRFSAPIVEVSSGTINDLRRKAAIEVDLVALGRASPSRPRKIVLLGEAKWGEVMGMAHLDRLRRARDLLLANGFDTGDTCLACFSGSGFDSELIKIADGQKVALFDPNQIYGI